MITNDSQPDNTCIGTNTGNRMGSDLDLWCLESTFQTIHVNFYNVITRPCIDMQAELILTIILITIIIVYLLLRYISDRA